MGFIRRGNYENNTVDGIIQIVNGFVRSKTEATNYSGRTPEESRDFSQIFIQLMSKTHLIIEGKCYIGITANPIESLIAHKIDIYADNMFFCMDIPSEDAAECRNRITKTGGFEPYFDESSDFIDNTYGQLYIYIYKISDSTTEKINTNGFTPLKQLPDKPIKLQMLFTDGTVKSRIYDKFSENDCNELISELKVLTEDNKLTEPNITHKELKATPHKYCAAETQSVFRQIA